MLFSRGWLVGSACVSLCGSATVSAAQVADTVRGVVFDSLLMAPLEGATVVAALADGGRTVGEAARPVSVITDSLGRFQLIAGQRIAGLTVYHDAFEFVGLSALEARRPETGGSAWRPTVSTPSLHTLWQRLCERPMPARGRRSIVFGTVRLADDSTRVAGAVITFGWSADQVMETAEERRRQGRGAPSVASTTAVTRSSPQGEYVLCGLPDYLQAGMVARGGAFASSEVLIQSDGRPVRRVDLVMADSIARTVLRGTLVDDEGRPIAEGTVTVDGVARSASTGPDGRFTLTEVPLGTRMLWARKVGYLPAVLAADVMGAEGMGSDARALRIVMERGTTLEGVRVTARRTVNREAAEFNRRIVAGQGKFLTGRELQARARISDALRALPSLQVRYATNGVDFAVLGNGRRVRPTAGGGLSFDGCVATVYVDGLEERQHEFLSALDIRSIAAIEVHPNATFAPMRFRPLNESCPVVLMWTKAFLMR